MENEWVIIILVICVTVALLFIVGTIGNNVVNKMGDSIRNRKIKKEQSKSSKKSLAEIYKPALDEKEEKNSIDGGKS